MAVGKDKMEATHAQARIQAFKDQESRKRWLFGCIGLFLVVDAAFFLTMLACAFHLVSKQPEAWHIFIAPALAGGIGTIVGIFMIKAVFGKVYLRPRMFLASASIANLQAGPQAQIEYCLLGTKT